MNKDTEKKLISLGLIATLTLGCGVAVTPIIANDNSVSEPTTTSTSIPAELVTLTPDPIYDLILPPEARATAIEATAVSVQNLTTDGLIQAGFPEKAITSQSQVQNMFKVTANVNGEIIMFDYGTKTDSTFVNMDGSGHDDYLLNISAGHGLSDSVKAGIIAQLMLTYGTIYIKIDSMVLDNITYDNNLIFKRDEVGIASFDDVKNDYEIVAIPLANLSPETANKLKMNAISYKDLMFTTPPEGDGYYGYCRPGLDANPVVADNVSNYGIDDDFSLLKVGPYLVDRGCSGSGVFVETSDGLKYVGITVIIKSSMPGENSFDFVYTLSKMGEQKFWQEVNAAKEDYINNK